MFNDQDLKNISKHVRVALPGRQVGRRQFWRGELAEQLRRFIHLVWIRIIILLINVNQCEDSFIRDSMSV